MHPNQYPYYIPFSYNPVWFHESDYAGAFRTPGSEERIVLRDYGQKPFAANINEAAKQNKTFRTALWTGRHLQVTLMSLNPGEDIGLEMHPHVDQFLRIEQGRESCKWGRANIICNLKEMFTMTPLSSSLPEHGTISPIQAILR